MKPPPWSLFEVAGLEIEVMVVDPSTFEPLPVADRVLAARAGVEPGVGDADDGATGWSNELVNHVLEFKNPGPFDRFAGVAAEFHRSMLACDALAGEAGGVLVTGAMHPWMDPRRQTSIWPHEGSEVYQQYHRIFDCHRHGWANLQSCHLNLPFRGDDEFRRLHSALRFLLPALPALTAASPYREGIWSGAMDHRLQVYAFNSAQVPEMTAGVIPEVVRSQQEYRDRILAPLLAKVRELDPSGVLNGEWLNARGCIARFDRDAVELRLLDAQECPQADVALSALVFAAARMLAFETHAKIEELEAWSHAELRGLLDQAAILASKVRLPAAYLAAFGMKAPDGATGRELWKHLAKRALLPAEADAVGFDLETILARGTLAERLVSRAGLRPQRADLESIMVQLRTSLLSGHILAGR